MGYFWTPAEDALLTGYGPIPGRSRQAAHRRRGRLGLAGLWAGGGATVKARLLSLIRERPGVPTPRLVALARVETDNRRAVVWGELRRLLAAGRVRRRIVRRVAVWELANS